MKINILIVDDSRTEANLLKHIFESDPEMHVIGIAYNGKEAVEMAERLKPNVITMDLEMPIMDGHTATRLIMSQNPIPIVIISSKVNDSSMDVTFLALEAGAVSVIAKPLNVIAKSFKQSQQRLIDTVRSMAEIKVIKRRRFKTSPPTKKIIIDINHPPGSFEIVAIGTSIGGPQVLKNMLGKLPADFPVPIVIVQHMSTGFITGFTKWLNHNTVLTVKNAEHNEKLKKGVVYFAPDNFHLTIARSNDHLVARLITSEPVSGFCPSITVLLQSVAKVSGKKAIGAILTGMGNDGAQGLLELKQAKGHTLIQDEKSCVVFGMAGVAQSLGAVDKVIEIDQLADYLNKMTKF